MLMQLFRVLCRTPGDDEWFIHVGAKGTQFYTTLPAVRSAVTQFERRRASLYEYKIQHVELPEWEDVGA